MIGRLFSVALLQIVHCILSYPRRIVILEKVLWKNKTHTQATRASVEGNNNNNIIIGCNVYESIDSSLPLPCSALPLLCERFFIHPISPSLAECVTALPFLLFVCTRPLSSLSLLLGRRKCTPFFVCNKRLAICVCLRN